MEGKEGKVKSSVNEEKSEWEQGKVMGKKGKLKKRGSSLIKK